MEETKVSIKIIKNDLDAQVEPSVIKNAVFVEGTKQLFCISEIKLIGKYDRQYTVVSDFVQLNENRVIVDGNILIICLFSEVAVIDLQQDKCIKILNFDCYEVFGVYKFKSGYFLRGEGANYFLNKDLEIIWEDWCRDIFVNYRVKEEFEIHGDYIAVFDWCGYKSFYSEKGKFKEEYYKEYDCDSN